MPGKKHAAFLFVLIACHLFYWLFVYPNPDEAYYWLWGRHPALSYHDHPALPPLLQGLFYTLFGNAYFVLRLPVFIGGMLSLWIYYLLLKKLQLQNKYTILLTIFSVPFLFLFTSFAWHDYLMIAMCLCSGYFWINFLTEKWLGKKGKTTDVFCAFLFLGLGGISKYNAVFLALGVATLVLFNGRLLRVVKDWRVYAGLLLCAVLISPVFIWNAHNQYGSFEFTLSQRTLQPLLEGRLFKGNIAGFIIGSIVLLTPMVLYFIIKTATQSARGRDAYTIVYTKFATHIFWWATGTFLFLGLFSNVLYYWNIPAYLFMLPLAVERMNSRFPKLIKATFIYSSVVMIAIVIHFGVIPLTVFVGGKDADGAYHYGWNTVAERVKKNEIYSDRIPLFGASYRIASLLAYKLNRTDVYSYSQRFDQFDYWTKNKKYPQQKALILADDYSATDDELLNIFDKVKIRDTIRIEKWNFFIKEYYLYEGTLKEAYLPGLTQRTK